MATAAYQRERYKTMSMATCHPDRKNHARGVCRQCYRLGSRGLKPTCHPNQHHVAKGLCKKCYDDLPENKATAVKKRRLKKYGLDDTGYESLVKRNGPKCPICGGEAGDIDHCHETGAVRGILCRSCNVGLGNFKDSKANLMSAIRYLGLSGSPSGDSWIQSFTGKKIFPLNLKPGEICIEDIAQSLSNTCRFSGHCSEFYSVAQHSVLVSMNVPEALSLAALMHDASEAYISDFPSPIKRVLYHQLQDGTLKHIKETEEEILGTIFQTLGVAWPDAAGWDDIKYADQMLLVTEARDLMKPLRDDWHLQEKNGFASLKEEIVPLGAEDARWAFMERWEKLRVKQ